jgi:hypothetical protein
MTKYAPLTTWLLSFDGDRVTLTFAQIEEMLGSALPASSHIHEAHWRGSTPGRPGAAIAAAGWGVERVDQMGQTVTLTKQGPPTSRRATSESRGNAIQQGSPAVARGDVPSDWYWEGHVQDVVVAYLRREGWIVTAESNTAIRARGDDIAAIRDGRQLVVEVKGYPSVGYRDPRRAGEVKRTNPTLQAKHWFADALLKLVRIRSMRSELAAAMALPDAPRYRSLIGETLEPLRRLEIGVFVVTPDGRVEVVLEPH